MSTTSALAYHRRAHGLARMRDYVELTKPRISIMVLVTVVVGACVAGWGPPLESPWVLFHALLGTALVAGSASALNQWLERHSDARMERTKDRPLPSGRLAGWEALVFGGITMVAGSLWLVLFVNLLTALLGLVTWLTYVCIYTPLKRRTTFNTVVGAVAGALPTLMGWAAVDGTFGLAAVTLFFIVYLWQFPHFMAIAYLYRDEYVGAGLRMLASVDDDGRRAGAQAVLSAALLVPVSLLPTVLQLAGPVYFLSALLLGAGYMAASALFLWRPDATSARGLLRYSLVYLPVLLVLFTLIPLI